MYQCTDEERLQAVEQYLALVVAGRAGLQDVGIAEKHVLKPEVDFAILKLWLQLAQPAACNHSTARFSATVLMSHTQYLACFTLRKGSGLRSCAACSQVTGDTSAAGAAARAPDDEHGARRAALGVDLAELPEYGPGEEDLTPGRPVRNTYAVKLAYFGPTFSAWAWAAGAPGATTQGAVQRALAVACGLDPGQQVQN